MELPQWLGTRPAGWLAGLLSARPDATVPPVPRDLVELADRLATFHSVAAAIQSLPQPAIQLIEVLQLLGPGADRAALAGWLGRAPGDPALAAVLDLLADRALVWPDGDRLHMVDPMYGAFRYPLRLGPPATLLLARYSSDQLRRIARTLDAPLPPRKADLIAGLVAVLADPDRVRAMVAAADPTTRERLRELAVAGPESEDHGRWYGYRGDPALRWAIERGMVFTDSLGVAQLAREVAVALRGPGWHAPFTPDRPEPALTEVDDVAVAREAAAAGGAAVEQLTTLLEAVAATPVALLKTGGLGVKELRRLARSTGIDEDNARLWLELAHDAALISPVRDRSGSGQLLPTPAYDDWAATEPAERLCALLPVWADLPAGPLAGSPEPGAKPVPVLIRDHIGQFAVAVRHRLLAYAAQLPAGRGVADPVGSTGPLGSVDPVGSIDPVGSTDPLKAAGDQAGPAMVAGLATAAGLAEAVAWHAPLLIGGLPAAGPRVLAAWREAELVGVVALGALSPLGRALLSGSSEDLAAAGRALLPPATEQVVFQADLTAMVPGTPARELARLLDAAADRESRGGATTWRFSAGSVRRALDIGYEPAALIGSLRARAVGGALPQPLSYLVGDVARRHGTVRVRAVACVLRVEDPALAAELAGARALRALRLSVIAPTVLGSAEPVAGTLSALRAAGYAPVTETDDGTVAVERVEQRRASRPKPASRAGRRAAVPQPARPVDPERLAADLLAAPARTAGPRRARSRPGPVPGADLYPEPGLDADPDLYPDPDLYSEPDRYPEPDLDAELAALAGHLKPGERRLLAHAIETAHPVTIGYTNSQGNRSTRVIDSAALDGHLLVAWCHLRDDERAFALHRIDSVAPAS